MTSTLRPGGNDGMEIIISVCALIIVCALVICTAVICSYLKLISEGFDYLMDFNKVGFEAILEAISLLERRLKND